MLVINVDVAIYTKELYTGTVALNVVMLVDLNAHSVTENLNINITSVVIK